MLLLAGYLIFIKFFKGKYPGTGPYKEQRIKIEHSKTKPLEEPVKLYRGVTLGNMVSIEEDERAQLPRDNAKEVYEDIEVQKPEIEEDKVETRVDTEFSPRNQKDIGNVNWDASQGQLNEQNLNAQSM